MQLSEQSLKNPISVSVSVSNGSYDNDWLWLDLKKYADIICGYPDILLLCQNSPF